MPVVDGAPADDTRAVYLMTRDNILEGDTGASGLARRLRRTLNPPAPLLIRVPAHVASNFEGLVVRADDVPGGDRHLWKLVRTSDHGDLLGAHGGLHQKWFNLYDEATRVPFVIARIGEGATSPRTVTAPTSHVDLVPTLLAAAGVDVEATAATLAESFSEVHPLPGRDLMPVVDGAPADETRAVYLMTRDNMLEGDTGASGLARRLKRTVNPPAPLRIRVPAHVASNFEGLVVQVDDVAGGDGHLWKLVRTFDDPATWTEPGVRHLAANGLGGEAYRMSPLDDQWELYDLTADPTESRNRWTDPGLHELRQHLRTQLKHSRASSVPERNQPWPYASRRPPTAKRSWFR